MASELLDKRLDYWKQKLLESGRHNIMINYRKTKATGIEFVRPTLAELFNRIAINEEALTFQKSSNKNADVREYSLMSFGEKLFPTLPFETDDVMIVDNYEESQKTLKSLYTKSKLAIEERGTNILHIVCGFIEWRYPNEPQSQWMRSPLVLVPVSLTAEVSNSSYILKRYEDEIVVNPYLAYLFEIEYGIGLPSFNAYDKTIDDFMCEMDDLACRCGWKIIMETSLTLLSSTKIAAYKDLMNNRNLIISNPVIRAISGDADKLVKNSDSLDMFKDDSILSRECFPVVKADSSQKAAILCAKKGISFVLQGPPGTGKSQTITNIIAEALADGKKVLFVSEKSTALEAVYKRLIQASLSEFCLPLYGYKLNKKEILHEIGMALELKQIKPSDDAPSLSQSQLNSTTSDIEKLPAAYCKLGENVSNNPWMGINPSLVKLDIQEEIKQNFYKAANILKSILGVYNEIREEYGLELDLSLSNLSDTTAMLYSASIIPEVPSKWLTDYESGQLLSFAKDMMETCQKHNALNSEVLQFFDKNVLNYDIQKWMLEFSKNLEGLKNKPILQLKNDSSYIDSLEDFKNGFISLRQTVSEIEEHINDFNDICGLKYKRSIGSIDLIASFLSLIITMPKSIESWFDIDFARDSLELLKKAKSAAKEIKDKKDVLLLNWEENILGFDYRDILDRYKYEYAGFFKHFNNEYRKDRRTILTFSKEPLKNFDDEAIIQLLLDLESIADNKKWFEENYMELINCFGEYYRGIDTPWEKIENWINGILNVSLHYNGEVPQKLKDFMTSGDLHENIEKINTIVTSLENEKTMAELLIARYTSIKEYIIMETDEIMASSDEILVTLECLKDNYCEFCSLLGDSSSDSIAVINSANTIYEWRRAQEDFKNNDSLCKEMFENYYNGLNTDWNRLISAINSVYAFKKYNPPEKFIRAICSKTDVREKTKVSANIIEELHKELKYSHDWICSRFENPQYIDEMSMDKLINKLMACTNDLPSLENWIAYLELKDESNKTGLDTLISEDSSLGGLMEIVRDSDQAELSILKDEQTINSPMRIREKLIKQLPDASSFSMAIEEMSVLLEEMGKNRNIVPLKRLFGSIPNLLMLLKPCLMMSPLSVSYFLDNEAYHFDLVIFDEASQILPEDAVGAIFRGSQVIIAGDSKQLLPTKLFLDNTGNYNDQSDFDADDDYGEFLKESILDEALKAIPERTLLTHYRSRHKQLIAFSNHEVYENKLIIQTCNEENSEGMGIRYIYVEDGYYERGNKNCNIPEINRCVKLVQNHICHNPERSLGIIAFSEKQRIAIEGAIDEFRKQNPQYEAFFDENNEEPFFVKNLADVQGYERDTIILSICYARDQDGRMDMSFGLLSKNGGERFLNVAVTRAKCNIDIVGSILPEDIVLSKTDSEGIKLLRLYIESALKGREVVITVKSDSTPEESQDSPCDIESQIVEGKGEEKNDIAEDNPYEFEFYRQWRKNKANRVNSTEELTKISDNIFEVLSKEQPIHIDLLYKRLGTTFPAGRATESIKRVIDDVIDREFIDKVRIDADSFIWLLPEVDLKVRIPGKGDIPRPMEYICREEVALAMETIVKKYYDISAEDLANECANVYGFERRGIKIKAKIEAALEHLIQKGKVHVVDGKVQLMGNNGQE